MTQTINQEVTVNAIYFSGSDMKTFPREIEYDGQAVAFASGLRYLVRRFGARVKPVRLTGNEDDDREAMKRAAGGPIDCVFDIMPPASA